jgi:hypothetical protein
LLAAAGSLGSPSSAPRALAIASPHATQQTFLISLMSQYTASYYARSLPFFPAESALTQRL